MQIRRVCLYFLTWHFDAEVEFDMREDERVVNIVPSGKYRIVWIEGTEKSRDWRFPNRDAEDEGS